MSVQNMLNKNFQRIKHWIRKAPEHPVHQAMVPGSPAVVSADVVWLQPLDTRPFEIDRISILFATFQRINTCRLDIRLFSTAHELLHYESVAAETLADNALYALKLADDFTYKGECYLFIASPDATPANCVAVWTASEPGGAGLREVPRSGRTFSEITPATQGGSVHRGVALVTTLGRHSRAHALRSYLQPGGGMAVRKQDGAPEVLGVVGFTPAELQTLSSLHGQLPLELQASSADDLDVMPQCQALLVSAAYDIGQGRTLGRFARRRGVPLIVAALDDNPVPPRIRNAWPAFADGLVTRHPQPVSRLPQAGLDDGLPRAVEKILDVYRTRRLPKVSIITILSGKADQLKWVIDSYFNQTYQGDIEVIYVDDCFGDAESVVTAEFARHSARPHAPRLSHTILRNERNLGNCASRNRGVAAATGDIIVIIDADCMLNRQFISAHVDAHAYLDCEVVIGPHNIETHGASPVEKLAELERTPLAALEESELQDPLFLDGFLNCITRNFSIKKKAIVEDLFDIDFSYSLAPGTGFGWEDVEMGYRLYKRALGIKFTEDAFSVHISHGSSVPEAEKPGKSIRNFHKLFLKHPELRDVARRWAVRTLDALGEWSSKVDPFHSENQDLLELKRLFADAPRSVPLGQTRRRSKLRILTYRWHVPHQYELYKSGHDFFLVRGTGSPMCDHWEYGHRPLPENANFIDVEDIRESEFDMALLHFDENVLNHENTNGQIGPEWGAAFRYFVERVNLPKVAICHGTPQFHGQYTPGYDKPDLMTVIEPARAALVDYVKDIEIVCNSHQALREWGFHKSRVIWHGFDPSEFLPSTYAKGILSPLGPLVKSRPHYRGFYLYQKVFSEAFPQAFLPETLSVPDPDIDYVDNVFAIAKYKNYVDQIRQYSVYFNPTLRSPMPRARCEPMMCGVVTVNANNHDVDLFIKNGVNGFYSNDPDELRAQLIYLMSHPEATRKMGDEARKTAISVFNHDRYLADWSVLLKAVV
jgi:glycosyltransferase involved in cell wall biosynthesis